MFQKIKALLNVVIQVNTVSAIIAAIDYHFGGAGTMSVVLYEILYFYGLYPLILPGIGILTTFFFFFMENLLPYASYLRNVVKFLYVSRMYSLCNAFEEDYLDEVRIRQYEHQMCGECAPDNDPTSGTLV